MIASDLLNRCDEAVAAAERLLESATTRLREKLGDGGISSGALDREQTLNGVPRWSVGYSRHSNSAMNLWLAPARYDSMKRRLGSSTVIESRGRSEMLGMMWSCESSFAMRTWAPSGAERLQTSRERERGRKSGRQSVIISPRMPVRYSSANRASMTPWPWCANSSSGSHRKRSRHSPMAGI